MKSTNILSRFGLSEPEQKLLIKATVISTAVCAAVVAGFWALNALTIDAASLLRSPLSFLSRAESDTGSLSGLDFKAHEFAAQRYLQSGQPDMALPHLRRIAAIRRDDRVALDGMLKAFLELEQFEHALECANHIIALSAGSPSVSVLVRRGIALYHLKRGEESAIAIRGVLDKDPENAEALCFMGQMEASDDPKSVAAAGFFKRAIAADPNYAEARYQMARYYENTGNYKNAGAYLKQTLAIDPLNVRAHARLGMVRYYERDIDGALQSYQTALALNPHDYNTRYNLGELYRTLLGDDENALREFAAALKDAPHHTDANFKAGLICAGNEMLKEAIRYFEAALQSNRKNIRVLLQSAAAYERLGDKSKAISIYEEILDIDPLYSIAIQKLKLLEE